MDTGRERDRGGEQQADQQIDRQCPRRQPGRLTPSSRINRNSPPPRAIGMNATTSVPTRNAPHASHEPCGYADYDHERDATRDDERAGARVPGRAPARLATDTAERAADQRDGHRAAPGPRLALTPSNITVTRTIGEHHAGSGTPPGTVRGSRGRACRQLPRHTASPPDRPQARALRSGA